ncbi:hypothetical protein GZ78_23655 [Endozoicomonas numazuensis]|uniref:Uncharacterized protein n=2 Tax=Endozoicomonas numazuensis TaxID=1137799 RepID=A0A081NCQ1_9GAMM|nr:hypothetical protein GZ78_23655 [Endozoicomonas numazuensis]
MGEVHVKDEYADWLGRKILDHFSFRGLENLSVNSSLAKAMLLPARIVRETSVALYSQLHNRPKISTISIAWEDGHPIPPEEDLDAPIINIHLESGASDIVTTAAWNYSLMVKVNLITLPLLLHSKFMRSSKFCSLIKIALLESYLLMEPLCYGLLSLHRGSRKAYLDSGVDLETDHPILFPNQYYLLNYRNRLMSDNIIRALKFHRERKTMLVIVGMAHVTSLEKRLKRDYNFRSTPFSNSQ